MVDETTCTSRLSVNRPVFDQAAFDKLYGSQYVELSVAGRIKKYSQKIRNAPSRHLRKWALTCFPPATWLTEYEWKTGLISDFLSGITVGVMNIPQGMAYGLLAGLPPQFGLYTSFFPPLLYAFFGTSKHISFGTFAVISLMVSAVIDKNVPLSHNNGTSNASTGSSFFTWACDEGGGSGQRDQTAVLNVAFALTFIVGFCQVCFGILHVGFISVYLSDQLVEGLTTGAAIQVFTSQVGKLFGFSGLPSASGVLGILKFYICLVSKITTINWATVIMSSVCLFVMILVKEFLEPPFKKKFRLPIPVELIIVIFGTLVSYLASFNTAYGMQIVGVIPTGIPAPQVPDLASTIDILPDAITIAIVIYSISVSMGKLFARKHDYKIKANQEWFAYGFVHIIASFFSCHCAGASLSRSAVQEAQGGKTQIASLFAAGVILIVLLALAPLFEMLPQCALAAIIVVNLKSLFKQFGSLPRLWKTSKIDFLIWIVTFLGVVLLDISLGLVIGLTFAILTILFRSQWPDSICLGRISQTELYKGFNAYSGTKEIPHMKIYRFDSPLYFANAALFKDELYRCTCLDPLEAKKQLAKGKLLKTNKTMHTMHLDLPDNKLLNTSVTGVSINNADERQAMLEEQQCNPQELRAIIVDCSSFPYIDLMGVDALKQVYEEYKVVGVQVMFVNVKVAVRQLFDVCDLYKSVPKSTFYLTVHDAVLSFLTSKSTIEALAE